MTEFIAPSKHNPWGGGKPDAFTAAQQMRAGMLLDQRKWPVAALPREYVVKATLEPKIGDNGMPRQASFLCPVLSARKDGTKLRVIAPDGSDQWVAWK